MAVASFDEFAAFASAPDAFACICFWTFRCWWICCCCTLCSTQASGCADDAQEPILKNNLHAAPNMMQPAVASSNITGEQICLLSRLTSGSIEIDRPVPEHLLDGFSTRSLSLLQSSNLMMYASPQSPRSTTSVANEDGSTNFKRLPNIVGHNKQYQLR